MKSCDSDEVLGSVRFCKGYTFSDGDKCGSSEMFHPMCCIYITSTQPGFWMVLNFPLFYTLPFSTGQFALHTT